MRSDRNDFSRRAQASELMDGPCSYEELRSCLQDLARINRRSSAYKPILQWIEQCIARRSAGRPITIVDAGCGFGDTLREVAEWAKRRGIPVELTGVDLNPHATKAAAAAENDATAPIRWVTGDVFSYRPDGEIDIVISSLFTHHLTDEEIVRFLEWMEKTASRGWFISDLHRHPIPYHFFKWWSKLTGCHRFVQHDGPVSFLRSFTRRDWEVFCVSAGLPLDSVKIEWHIPFRWCLGRTK